MVLLKIIVGVLLLAFGRKLVWLFIGLVGFVAGLSAAQTLIPDQPVWYMIAVGAGVGLLMVLIARFVKNIAFGLGGFLLGAYLVNGLLTLLKLELGTLGWIFILMGGALGAFFMLAAFEWALKILSSFAGSMLIAQILPPEFAFRQVFFIGLVILGVVLQTRLPHGNNRVPG
jgi:MFS family permease